MPPSVPPGARTVLVDALAAHFGGHATAAIEVARRLPGASGIDHVVVVAPSGSLVDEGLRATPDVDVLALPPWGRADIPRRLLWQAVRLPALASDARVAGVLSWSGILPRPIGPPLVCYLANSLAFEGSGAGNRLRRLALRRTAARASSLLVPSEAMSELVTEACGRQPELVRWGVDHERLSPAPEPGEELLCVADFYRHKRQHLVLEIWAALPAPRPPLRLIGDSRVDPAYFASVAATARELVETGAGSVRVDDRLPFDELIGIYGRARALVLPSLHESFCLPLLEAQACGIPCVTTDREVMHGTAGAGAVYVGPGEEVETWTAAVRRLFADDEAHRKLREAAIANAARFSWEQTATAVARHLVRPES